MKTDKEPERGRAPPEALIKQAGVMGGTGMGGQVEMIHPASQRGWEMSLVNGAGEERRLPSAGGHPNPPLPSTPWAELPP